MCLRIAAVVVDGLSVDRTRCLEAAAGGYSNATELADYLVGRGVPFREAHDVTGRVVREAIRLGLPLERMRLETLRAIDRRIGEDVFGVLTVEACLARRDVAGGTAVARVRAALDEAERLLAVV